MRVKAIDYSLIESDDHEEFVQEVFRKCTTEGWVPAGGVCVWFRPGRPSELVLNDGTTHYAQALVKYAAVVESAPADGV